MTFQFNGRWSLPVVRKSNVISGTPVTAFGIMATWGKKCVPRIFVEIIYEILSSRNTEANWVNTEMDPVFGSIGLVIDCQAFVEVVVRFANPLMFGKKNNMIGFQLLWQHGASLRYFRTLSKYGMGYHGLSLRLLSNNDCTEWLLCEWRVMTAVHPL